MRVNSAKKVKFALMIFLKSTYLECKYKIMSTNHVSDSPLRLVLLFGSLCRRILERGCLQTTSNTYRAVVSYIHIYDSKLNTTATSGLFNY